MCQSSSTAPPFRRQAHAIPPVPSPSSQLSASMSSVPSFFFNFPPPIEAHNVPKHHADGLHLQLLRTASGDPLRGRHSAGHHWLVERHLRGLPVPPSRCQRDLHATKHGVTPLEPASAHPVRRRNNSQEPPTCWLEVEEEPRRRRLNFLDNLWKLAYFVKKPRNTMQ